MHHGHGKKCDAITPASSYAPAHPCLKKNGLMKVGKKTLCAHHRAALEARKEAAQPPALDAEPLASPR